jgi:hypothetical protein
MPLFRVIRDIAVYAQEKRYLLVRESSQAITILPNLGQSNAGKTHMVPWIAKETGIGKGAITVIAVLCPGGPQPNEQKYEGDRAESYPASPLSEHLPILEPASIACQ